MDIIKKVKKAKKYFSFKDMKDNYLVLIPYLKKYWKSYTGLVLITVFSIVTTIAFAWFLGDVTNAAVSSNFTQIKTLIPLGILLVLMNLTISFLDTYLETVTMNAIKRDLKETLLKKVLLLPVSRATNIHSGELSSHFTADANNIDGMIGRNLINLIKLPLMSVAVFVYLSNISLKLSLIGLAVAPVAMVGGAVFGYLMRNRSRTILKLIGKTNTNLNEIFQGLFVIRSFMLEKLLFKKYQNQNNQLYDLEIDNAKLRGFYSAGGSGIGLITYFSCLSLGAIYVSEGSITVGALLSFVNLVNHLVYPLNGLAGQWASLQRSISAVERIAAILKEDTESDELPRYISSRPLTISIEFQHVHFGYNQESLVLENLNLRIPAGKTVAIVGSSGAGKTTITNLLQGFYKPINGNILFDNVPIEQLSPSELRSYIAHVPQETYLFSGTIKYNLLLAHPDATEEQMMEAAKIAHIHDYILSLPNGYDTEIGERGVRLSGGQKQRMAIARAIIKDAPILLLDEATSALDSETEFYVQEAMQSLMKERTTIVIAHRLSTIQHADLIVVMNNGEIVEMGKHEELIMLGGLYQELNRIQNTEQDSEKIAVS